MGIQAMPLFYNNVSGGGGGGGEFTGIEWPDIACNEFVKRWVDIYEGQLYAVYAVWDATSSAEFTVNEGGLEVDFYMIAPGASGTAGSSTVTGNGGSAGKIQQTNGLTLAQTTYGIVLSNSVTRIEDGQNTISVTNGGYSAGSPYNLFGDTNHAYGVAGTAETGGLYLPGQGATGCTFLPRSALATAYTASTTRFGIRQGAMGIGAGGNGGARTDTLSSYMTGLTGAGAGATGMFMMRIAI
jgi:hypothetical protein